MAGRLAGGARRHRPDPGNPGPVNHQPVTQGNIQGGERHEHIVITLGAGSAGSISDLDIGLIVSDNHQTNDAVQVAVNWADHGWHLIG